MKEVDFMALSTKALDSMIEIALNDCNCSYAKTTDSIDHYTEYEILAKDFQEEIAIDDLLNIFEDFAKNFKFYDDNGKEVTILNDIKITLIGSNE